MTSIFAGTRMNYFKSENLKSDNTFVADKLPTWAAENLQCLRNFFGLIS